VWELRIDFGPGYRVYYAQESGTIVLLLSAGSKRTQSADVEDAVQYWRDYQRRKK
jgi:putative addiction module killer protein